MININNFLTLENIKKLQEEIDNRKGPIRRIINEDLKEAKAHGDLSENFEYKAAKRDRAQNEGRIRFLERMIRSAIIIKESSELNEVDIGRKVSLTFLEDNLKEDYFIVTTIESDPFNNKISIESPIGKAIFKKKLGEELCVNSPNGSFMIKIEAIEKI